MVFEGDRKTTPETDSMSAKDRVMASAFCLLVLLLPNVVIAGNRRGAPSKGLNPSTKQASESRVATQIIGAGERSKSRRTVDPVKEIRPPSGFKKIEHVKLSTIKKKEKIKRYKKQLEFWRIFSELGVLVSATSSAIGVVSLALIPEFGRGAIMDMSMTPEALLQMEMVGGVWAYGIGKMNVIGIQPLYDLALKGFELPSSEN